MNINIDKQSKESYEYVEDNSNHNNNNNMNSSNNSTSSLSPQQPSKMNSLISSIDQFSISTQPMSVDYNNNTHNLSSSLPIIGTHSLNSSFGSNGSSNSSNGSINDGEYQSLNGNHQLSMSHNGNIHKSSTGVHINHHSIHTTNSNNNNNNSNNKSKPNQKNNSSNQSISDENYYSMAKMYLNNRPTTNTQGLGRVNFNMKSEDLDQTWFHKEATRDVAIALLNHNPIGSFLIRPSSQIGSYAMSWVKNEGGEIGHNLIYGLCPGYSLKQYPTTTTDRYWSLQNLVENCDYLKSAVKVSSSTTAIAKSKNSKTSTEVLGRIIERLTANDASLVEMVWTLCIIGENENTRSSEKRTCVKYAEEEYTAPECLPLNGGSMNLLAQALQSNTHIHSVFINGYEGYLKLSFQPNIGDAEAQAVATILSTNKSLTLLNLSLNDFTDKGAKIIAEALKGNTTLKFLSLSYNFIAKEGLIALTDAIRVNKTIDFIDISNQLVKRRNIIQSLHQDVERTLMTLLEDTMKRKCELFGMYEIKNNNLDSISIPPQIHNQQQNISFNISLQKLAYFHGFLTKQQAEKRLNAVAHSNGSFLFYLNFYIPNSIYVAIQVIRPDNKVEIFHKMIHRVHHGYRFVGGGGLFNPQQLSQQMNNNSNNNNINNNTLSSNSMGGESMGLLREEAMEEEALYNFQINNQNHDNTVTHTNSYNYSYRYRPKRVGCGVVIPTLFEFCSWILASHPQYKEIYDQLYNINSIIGDRFQDIHDLVPLWGLRDVKPVVALGANSKHNTSRKGVYPTLSQLYKLNKSKLTNPVTRDQYYQYRCKYKEHQQNQLYNNPNNNNK